MVRDSLTEREREERRKQAVEATERGFDRHEVSEIFGVSSHAVWEWAQVYDEHGMSGLEEYSQSKEYLKNTSSDRLFNMLSEVEDSKATQKIIIALIYNELDYVDKSDISEVFNITVSTVRNWLSKFDEVSEKPISSAIEAISSSKNGTEFELNSRKRTRGELAARRKEAITLLSRGFSAKRVSEIFDVSENSVRRWKSNYDEEGWRGLENKSRFSTNNSERFENMSKEYLLDILSNIDKSKPAQKVMLAIHYKGVDYITQKDIAQIYGLNRRTINEWFSQVELCENGPPEKILRDRYNKININKNKIPNRRNRELDTRRKEAIRLLSRGFPIEEVSGIFDVPTNTIQHWGQIYNDNGWEGLESAKLNADESTKQSSEKQNKIECVEINELYSELDNIGDYPTQRLLAAILYKKGATIPEVSDLTDTSKSTINKWFNKLETKSIAEAVQRNPIRGRPMKLSEDKFPVLENFLLEGAEAHGFVGQVWTGKRVAKVIEEQFDISVSTSTARNYLRKIGWSNKKPQRRSTKRDEGEIKEFLSERWEEIRQYAKTQTKPIVFIDETKFRLMPTFKSTWAPIGETPTVETSGLFEYVAVIGALVYHPKTHKLDLQWEKQRHNFKTRNVLNFFQNLIQKIPQESVFILDNLAAHKAAVDILEGEEIKDSIRFEWFPEYASDINPVDNVWGQAKYNELANYAPKDLDELETKIEETLTDIQNDESVLRYCVKDAGLEIEA